MISIPLVINRSDGTQLIKATALKKQGQRYVAIDENNGQVEGTYIHVFLYGSVKPSICYPQIVNNELNVHVCVAYYFPDNLSFGDL